MLHYRRAPPHERREDRPDVERGERSLQSGDVERHRKVHFWSLYEQSVRKRQRAVARRVVVGDEAGGHVRAPVHVRRPLLVGKCSSSLDSFLKPERLNKERLRSTTTSR